MSVEVLTRSAQNVSARAEMIQRGLNLVSPWYVRVIQRAIHKTRIIKGVSIGDGEKSWDVLKTIQFVEENVGKTDPILDIGAYASEALCILHRLGFSSLTGIDLNPRLAWMPYGDAIKYVQDDFTRSPFASQAFKVITAVSVLEHGFQENDILREMSRILMPGGYFIGSIDYWPEKVDTSGVKLFGLDWRIFSKAEVLSFVERASGHGLFPVGNLNLEAGRRIVHCLGKRYTFAWFAFRKNLVS